MMMMIIIIVDIIIIIIIIINNKTNNSTSICTSMEMVNMNSIKMFWHLFNKSNCIPLTVKGKLYEFCSSCLRCAKAFAQCQYCEFSCLKTTENSLLSREFLPARNCVQSKSFANYNLNVSFYILHYSLSRSGTFT